MQQRTPAPRDTLVQVTPDLTYADYARRGFFELVFAVVLVVPVLLAADWLLDRRIRRDDVVFRGFAGAQIGIPRFSGCACTTRATASPSRGSTRWCC